MMSEAATGAGGLPRLDAFDQEFEGEPETIAREHRRGLSRRTKFGLVLGAAIISVPALAWLNADALRSSAPPASMLLQSASRKPADEQVARLAHEIAELKQELGELTRAHQQAIERIVLLQADQESRSSPTPSYWYSDLAALSFESASQSRPPALGAAARRPLSARSEGREFRRRENAEPLSLEAPQ